MARGKATEIQTGEPAVRYDPEVTGEEFGDSQITTSRFYSLSVVRMKCVFVRIVEAPDGAN
jgi:hypothetical protein